MIVTDTSNVESSYPALRRISTTRVSARLGFGGEFRWLTLRRVAPLIGIVSVSAGIDRFRRSPFVCFAKHATNDRHKSGS